MRSNAIILAQQTSPITENQVPTVTLIVKDGHDMTLFFIGNEDNNHPPPMSRYSFETFKHLD
jgi:hypothetical protein